MADCAVIERSPNGDPISCDEPALWIVRLPWGDMWTCEPHARTHALQGFKTFRADRACASCGHPKHESDEIYLLCWCGAPAKRYRVDGLWYALCEVHRAPPLWDLVTRMKDHAWDRFVRLFATNDQKNTQALETAALRARERAAKERR